MGMRFVTVDIDPINTGRASRVIRHLNPQARAVTRRGEDFLAEGTEPLDYVYLDAFDFEHGQHSDMRQERYRKLLGTEIRDDESWRMHQLCAAAILSHMGTGGIVVIDDTWTDEDGALAGKGKLAVPLLLAGGFVVIARTKGAIALRRTKFLNPSDSHDADE